METPLERFQRMPKIELHIHMTGAVRWATLMEIMKEKNMTLPGDGSYQDLKNACVVTPPGESLPKFLDRFNVYHPALIGNLGAIERMAYELCEDQAKNNVIYFEGRFWPHLLSTVHGVAAENPDGADDPNVVTPSMVVECVLKGFRRGEKDFNIKARLILSCHGPKPEWSDEVVNLCLKFKNEGVVAMDITGSMKIINSSCAIDENSVLAKEHILAYEKARKLGIHRTAHACEVGPPEVAEAVLDQLHTERIGHGYNIVQKNSTYQMILEKQVHLECCPTSSYCTGSVSMDVEHPIVRFVNEGMNFSLSSDNPTITGTRMADEFLLANKLGLTNDQIVKSIYNAAKSSFLPDCEKQQLIQKLDEAFSD